MRFKRLPGAEIPGQFTLAESGVNFSVADPVNQGFGFSALTPRYQMVFIHAAAGFKLPAAKWAESRSHRLDVAQRFSAAKGAFGNHLTQGYFSSHPFILNCRLAALTCRRQTSCGPGSSAALLSQKIAEVGCGTGMKSVMRKA